MPSRCSRGSIAGYVRLLLGSVARMPPRTLARRQAQVVAVFLAVLAAWYGTHDYRYAEDLHHSAGERRSASSICEGLDGPLTGTGPSLAMLATLKDSDPQSEASIRQRNALRSWRAVFPDAALYFAGAAPADLTSELGAVQLHQVRTTAQGTPLLNSMIEDVLRISTASVLMYANADIVFTRGMSLALDAACRELDSPFMLVGHRFEVPLNEPLNFTGTAWRERLAEAESDPEAYLRDRYNKDYFLFSRGLWQLGRLPDLVPGRAEVDNYLMQDAIMRGRPVVDTTPVQRVYHPSHGYGHLRAGKTEAWTGAEAQINQRAMTERFGRNIREMAHLDHCPLQMVCGDEGAMRGSASPHCAEEGSRLAVRGVPRNAARRVLFAAGFFHLWVPFVVLAVAVPASWVLWHLARTRITSRWE